MNEIFYSPLAQNDLEEIERYISGELDSPLAAQNTRKRIFKCIHRLETYAAIGVLLMKQVDFETTYRSLVCENYIVFYYVEQNKIYISRVLYGRRDYLRILFGDLPHEEE